MIERDVFRTIKEWLVFYSLETSAKNIYVEGSVDQHFIASQLDQHGLTDVVVYDADALNIEYEEFVASGLEDNNRGRIIYFAGELERQSKVDLFNNVVCLVDADFDYLFGTIRSEKLLVLTDYSAIELYAFSPGVVTKVLTVVFRLRGIDSDSILRGVTEPLLELFLIRATQSELRTSIEMLPIDKCCEITDGKCTFDTEEYVRRLLNKGGQMSICDRFMETLSKMRERMPSELRRAIHAHDFSAMLWWYVNRVYRPRFKMSPELLEGILLTALSEPELKGTPLFAEIRRRLAAA
jgi:hypothetical protein